MTEESNSSFIVDCDHQLKDTYVSYLHTSHTCVGSVNECLWERHVTFSAQEDEYSKR